MQEIINYEELFGEEKGTLDGILYLHKNHTFTMDIR